MSKPTEMERFEALVSRYPRFAGIWSFGTPALCDTDLAHRELRVCATGEAVILKALLSIWSGSDGFPIEFSDLGTLDENNRRPLAEWVANPFFP